MAETKDFLLEVGCEEMPSAPLASAQAQLARLSASALTDAGLAHGAIECHSTPRRLSVLVHDVAMATEEVHEVRRGPATGIAFDAEGRPTKAAQGFARKMGLGAEQLVVRGDGDGKDYVFAETSIPSRPAQPILSAAAKRLIASLEWPNYRSQRWGSEHATFVRPVRWICALLGDEVIPVSFADVTSSNATRGHRVLGAGEHAIANPSAYRETLRSAGVMLEDERREAILAGVARIEEERGGAHVDTPRRVLDEVVNLCEWPTLLVGRFDEEFLAVPHEIICESMLSNQRYFPIYDASGALTREFVVVSNADPAVSPTVVAGNERVVRARLDDAKFFYDEDLKVPLDDFVERLDRVTFQERLGTMRQKVERMESLSAEVARGAGQGDEVARLARRAAHLAKADLVSQAVVEFTNQQGVMGGYYAKAAGESAEVASAIREHYRPRFAGDALPEGVVGKAVAIADKLDTICGMFAIDEPPTGSSDPFAQRRAAIGIIAMARAMPTLSLRPLIGAALDAYARQGLTFDAGDVAEKVALFFAGRLATIARDDGVSPDTIEAVSSVGVIDPDEFLHRAHALDGARADAPEVFDDLATAYARAAHLGDARLGTTVDEALMGQAERELLHACERGAGNVEKSLSMRDFDGACRALAELKEPIDHFFDDVLVMDEDTVLRENRLRLLNKFASVFSGVADIGALSRRK
ncbi:glycine--tRNA ligase subunit beta [Olsenella uli]|uniref:glycine--tRNA ligase subunit beta n=1 Tax=Olsenella uli TaxID=133926 RepID=UPI00044BE7B6|nr:glycine--tRNA ligase subunit beta [Olsenella uli]EUB32764.1 glycine--tRNA ligase, beta subunit [Olsenella uli MSTE5]